MWWCKLMFKPSHSYIHTRAHTLHAPPPHTHIQNNSLVLAFSFFSLQCTCMRSCYYYTGCMKSVKWLVYWSHSYQGKDWQCWHKKAVGPRKWFSWTKDPAEWSRSWSVWKRAPTWNQLVLVGTWTGDLNKEGVGLSTHLLGLQGM
jgi:hypothetical protein